MEQLLHYVWRHRIYPLQPLRTTGGEALEVIDPGLPNCHAGPDFFNAKVKIGGTLWAGDVEVHDRASDWLRHGHDRDRAYDRVVLHVVGEADCDVCRTDGEPIPQLLLPCPDSVRRRYDELCLSDACPPCRRLLPELPLLKVHSWLASLQAERLRQKAQAVGERLKRCDSRWEDAFFVTLARNFGFGLNSDAFEAWALRLPFRAVDKHRDSLFQVEALFFGTAGLLDETSADDYARSLCREYAYLSRKFSLSEPLPREQTAGTPAADALGDAYPSSPMDVSNPTRSMGWPMSPRAPSVNVRPADYWTVHYSFGKPSARRTGSLSRATLDLLVLNTVVPFFYAYGLYRADDALCDRALRFLETLQPENNRIIRSWAEAGLAVQSAADSQAVLQLQKEYCDKRDCLRCRFGYEYLKLG